MNARGAGRAPAAAGDDDRQAPTSPIAAIDWAPVHAELDMQGAAVIRGLLAPQACRDLAAKYPHDAPAAGARHARRLPRQPAPRCQPPPKRSAPHRRDHLPRREVIH